MPFQLQNFYALWKWKGQWNCNSGRSVELNMVIVLKLSLCLSKCHAMNAYAGVGVKPHSFLTLSQGEW